MQQQKGSVLIDDLLSHVRSGIVTIREAEDYFQSLYPGNYKIVRYQSLTKIARGVKIDFKTANDMLLFQIRYPQHRLTNENSTTRHHPEVRERQQQAR